MPRWCSATWIDLLVEKHAWLSAGLMWLLDASATGKKALFSGEQQGKVGSMPTISLSSVGKQEQNCLGPWMLATSISLSVLLLLAPGTTAPSLYP